MSTSGASRYFDPVATAANYARWGQEIAAARLAAVGLAPRVVPGIQSSRRIARAALKSVLLSTIRDVAVVAYTSFDRGHVLARMRDPISGDPIEQNSGRQWFDAERLAHRANFEFGRGGFEDGVVWRDAPGTWYLRGEVLNDGDAIDRRIGSHWANFERGVFIAPESLGARPRWRSAREPERVRGIGEADLMQWARHLREEWLIDVET